MLMKKGPNCLQPGFITPLLFFIVSQMTAFERRTPGAHPWGSGNNLTLLLVSREVYVQDPAGPLPTSDFYHELETKPSGPA